MDQKIKGFGSNQRGRIILLGDGTEVLTDSDDTEMFDHSEEDQDLASQVSKAPVPASNGQESKAAAKETTASPEPQYKSATDEASPKSSSTPDKKQEAPSSDVKDK